MHAYMEQWTHVTMLLLLLLHPSFRSIQTMAFIINIDNRSYKWCDVRKFFPTVVNWITWHWLKFWVQFHFCYSIPIHSHTYIQTYRHTDTHTIQCFRVCAPYIQSRCPFTLCFGSNSIKKENMRTVLFPVNFIIMRWWASSRTSA